MPCGIRSLTGLCSTIYLAHAPDGDVAQVIGALPGVRPIHPSAWRGAHEGSDSTGLRCVPNRGGIGDCDGGQAPCDPSLCPSRGGTKSGECASRDFALFMQPDVSQVIGENETCGSFSKEVLSEGTGM